MKSDGADRQCATPVAIIGISCRLPGAAGPDEFWRLLASRGDAIGPIPSDRWDVDYYYNPTPAQPYKMYTRVGGFLADAYKFDADFFGISPREAAQMDPQQRLAIELTWEALESAGVVPGAIAGSQTSVVMGVSSQDYAALQREQGEGREPYIMSGSALSLVSNRISYIFDFHGPSFSVDTACSSSLVAVHEACESLRRGDATLAIAGGVNMILSPFGGIGFSRAHMLSPTGRCQAFDARADGYVRAEGGGVVVLKRLDAALADGDRVHAVILATGVNSDGRTSGIALPNGPAQEELLRRVYFQSGIDPGSVDYVEAHGTGTTVGDPIECASLGAVIGTARRDGTPCLIGSVKSNIGHLESAAGIAGLLKAVLALRHREVPPTLHFETPNPAIAFSDLNLSVVDAPVQLDGGTRPLVMGVNSFGFGGTNAHVVLREHRGPSAPDAAPARGLQPLLISARHPAARLALAQRYEELLRRGDVEAGGICRAAALTRTHHSFRLATFGESATEIADRLAAFVKGDAHPAVIDGQASAAPARVALVFSGNGSQWVGMGRDLLDREPLIGEWIARIDAELRPLTGWPLHDAFGANAKADAYDRTEIAQPALFALQVAMVEWLRANGVSAAACVGHSVGEVAAAYASGILSLPQACRVIAHRSAVQGKTAGLGKMAAVGLSAERMAEYLPAGDDVVIAAMNSPASVTLSGDEKALDRIGDTLTAEGVFYRPLALDYAFHSRTMDPVRAELLERVAGLEPGGATIPFVSTVTGKPCDGSALGPGYWWDNIRLPVRFAEAIHALSTDGVTVFLEIGPHPVLTGYVGECLRADGAAGTAVGTLRRREPEPEALRTAIAGCYVAGATLDYAALFAPGRRHAELPTYPWQGEHHFLVQRGSMLAPSYGARQHPLLGYRLPSTEAIWHNELQLWQLPYLADHVIQGSVVFPAAGYVEMAVAAAALKSDAPAIAIDALEIRRPIVFSDREAPRVEFALSGDDGSFRISLRDGSTANPSPIAVGRLVPLESERPSAEQASVAALRSRLTGYIDAESHYRSCADRGLAYGPAFQGVAGIWHGHDEALGEIVAPDAIAGHRESYRLHPAVFDSCMQVAFAVVADPGDRAPYVPTSIARLRLYGTGDTIDWCHVRVRQRRQRAIVVDLVLLGDDKIVGEIEGLSLRRLDQATGSATGFYHWAQALQPRSSAMAGNAAIPSLRSLQLEARKGVETCPAGDLPAHAIEGLAAAYAASAIDELSGGNADIGLDSLADRGAVPPRRLPFLRAMLALAERHGLLAPAGGGWRRRATPWPDPSVLWRKLVADHPGHIAILELLARSGSRIRPHLQGADEGDPSPFVRDEGLVEQLLDSDPLFQPRNAIAASVVAKIVRDLPAGNSLRILEVNAGTGELARVLLPVLPADRIDYVYTDFDDDIVASARAKYADVPWLRCQTLDLARDPADQGFASQDFDVVLVGNAMFDVAELKPALGAIAKLLKPAGLMMVLGTGCDDILAFVFGMSPRWWAFTDIDLRPDAPFLAADKWPSLVESAGFEDLVEIRDERAGTGPGWAILARSAKARAEPVPVPGGDRRNWLLVAGADPAPDLAVALARKLEHLGHSVTTLGGGEQLRRLGPNGALAPLDGQPDYAAVLGELAREPVTARLQLVFLGMSQGVAEPADPTAGQDRAYELIRLCQAADKVAITPRLDLWVVTAGAMAAPGRSEAVAPAQAMLWGVARTILNERPDLVCRLVDLDPRDDALDMVAKIVDEVLHPDDEDEVIQSGAGRYVNRLSRGLPRAAAAGARDTQAAYRVFIDPADGRDDVGVRGCEPPTPAPDEVLVRVRAAGLNFRDVLQRSTILPEEAFEGGFAGATLGMEFAGEVVGVGAAVTDHRVGDAVFGFAPAALASHVATKSFAAFPKPPAWSFAEAATVPIAMMTALYSLEHLARLQPGERVLIHGAAGGVGLAAIQCAQWLGAEIFATAGTPQKRDFLRRLGVVHVLDSRTLAFADDIRRLTDGEGVDVVLNSIAGEAIAAGISVLRPFGRFIELGKRDFYANSKIGLQPFRSNLEFFGVDVDRLLVDRRDLAARQFARLKALIAEGALRPLPYRAYPAARAAEAFRHMQQSRHIGKVVLSFEAAAPLAARAAERPLALKRDATYLVTGGRGGFGLATAEWLAAQGAAHLVLVGRRAETAPDAVPVITRLRAEGVSIVEAAVDVTDGAALAGLLRTIDRDMPPLRGAVHCAGVIHDAPLATLSRERFDEVVRPKVLGAWHLHRLTRDRPLDFFVLYSSAVTLIGNPGQAHYLAANLYLEALAALRVSQGLPALAMQWGAIGEVGHIARNPDLEKTMTERLGIVAMRPGPALETMKRALAACVPQVAVAELDWTRLGRLPGVAKAPKYSVIGQRAGTRMADRGETGVSQFFQLDTSLSPAEAAQLILPEVVKQVSEVMRISVARLDVDRSLIDLGMDSLMMVELQMMMEQKFGFSIPVLDLMDVMTIGQVAVRLSEEVLRREASNGSGPTPQTEIDVDGLPEEQLDEVLGKLLEQQLDRDIAERNR